MPAGGAFLPRLPLFHIDCKAFMDDPLIFKEGIHRFLVFKMEL